MRSSFYNMSMTDMDFKNSDHKSGKVVDQLNIRNILELSNKDKALVE